MNYVSLKWLFILPAVLIFLAAYAFSVEHDVKQFSTPPFKILDKGEQYVLITGQFHLQIVHEHNNTKHKNSVIQHNLLLISRKLNEEPRGLLLSVVDNRMVELMHFATHAKLPDHLLFPDLYYKYFAHTSLRRILLQKGVDRLPCSEAVFQFSPPKNEDACVSVMQAFTVAVVYLFRKNPLLYVHESLLKEIPPEVLDQLKNGEKKLPTI